MWFSLRLPHPMITHSGTIIFWLFNPVTRVIIDSTFLSISHIWVHWIKLTLPPRNITNTFTSPYCPSYLSPQGLSSHSRSAAISSTLSPHLKYCLLDFTLHRSQWHHSKLQLTIQLSIPSALLSIWNLLFIITQALP